MPEKNSVRLALVSMKTVPGDLDANLARHRLWLDRAMQRQPDFIGFPEFALTGWIYEPAQMLSLRAAALKQIDAWARDYEVHLATCFVEKRAGRFFNTCLVSGPRGRLGVMRKVNLVGAEAGHYAPGRDFPVFDLGGFTMGVCTCADASRFEMPHLLSLRGAEVIFAPHANSLGKYGNCRSGWRRWRRERWPMFAEDSCVYIAGMSCAGRYARRRRDEEEQKYCGGGMVVDWQGKTVASLEGKGKNEGLLVADLDLAGLRQARREHRLSADFRPAIVYNRPRGWALGRRSRAGKQEGS